jgi:N-acetylmuramoyl-L-alanine amidase
MGSLVRIVAGATGAVMALTVALTGCEHALSLGAAQKSAPVNTATTTVPGDVRPSGAPLAGKVIVLDPGHNGGNAEHPEIINKPVDVITRRKPCNTTGTATDDGYHEHAFTWDVAVRLAKFLRAKGATVVLTRPNDTGVGPCIDKRAEIANKANADAALSIHADGAKASGHGFHIIEPALIKGHTDKIASPSKKLGMDMRDAFIQYTGIPYSNYIGKNGISVRDDLGGLNLAKVPSVFIECGNMQNPGDAAKLKAPKFRQRIAKALANGFLKYLSS